MSVPKPKRVSTRARSAARRLALQALYQFQLNPQPWQDLYGQYSASDEAAPADLEYFRELVQQILGARESLDTELERFADRPAAELDPIEHAALLIGIYELRVRLDVPFRVVINEGVELARRFGSTDGHKFVNAVLDGAAAALRMDERSA